MALRVIFRAYEQGRDDQRQEDENSRADNLHPGRGLPITRRFAWIKDNWCIVGSGLAFLFFIVLITWSIYVQAYSNSAGASTKVRLPSGHIEVDVNSTQVQIDQ